MASHVSFSFRHQFVLAFAALTLIAGGCAVEDGEVADETFLGPNAHVLGGGGSGGDPNTNNTLDDQCTNYTGVLSTLHDLAQGPLADSSDNLPSMPDMPPVNARGALTDCRRELLKVLIECALDGAPSPLMLPASVKDPADTSSLLGPKVYYGRHGLAPNWTSRRLTEDEQEFVSACVMARTNYYGATIDILMEGHAPLQYDADWRSDYPYAESTVWGNLFTSTPSRHVCHNYGNGLCDDAAWRICDVDNNCSFTNHGDCVNPLAACAGLVGTPPSYCNAWSNKISVFLEITDPVCQGATSSPYL